MDFHGYIFYIDESSIFGVSAVDGQNPAPSLLGLLGHDAWKKSTKHILPNGAAKW